MELELNVHKDDIKIRIIKHVPIRIVCSHCDEVLMTGEYSLEADLGDLKNLRDIDTSDVALCLVEPESKDICECPEGPINLPIIFSDYFKAFEYLDSVLEKLKNDSDYLNKMRLTTFSEKEKEYLDPRRIVFN